MARYGVFNRNDNSLHPVDRSVQYFDHSHTTTLPYGQITPVFCEQMYPNEHIKINVTNLLRSIPMKTPMLSRVRLVTRFYAVPNRIMWQGWEEYADAVKDSRFRLEEPIIANFNALADFVAPQQAPYKPFRSEYYTRASFVTQAQTVNPNITDYSVVGFGLPKGTEGRAVAHGFARALRIDPSSDFAPEVYETCGYQFFPHELGDYLNCPVFTASLCSDVSGRISAFPFAAYQLCYSYGYRNANVQDRVDDLYEMSDSGKSSSRIFSEMASFYADYNPEDKTVTTPLADYFDLVVQDDTIKPEDVNPSAVYTYDTSAQAVTQDITDMSGQSDESAVNMTSWEGVEHFPLKGGVNMVMHSLEWNADGTMIQEQTRISLTRLRYANWSADRFTEANPWQQRGDEARIPVVGTATMSGADVAISGSVPISAKQDANPVLLKTVTTRRVVAGDVDYNTDYNNIVLGIVNPSDSSISASSIDNPDNGIIAPNDGDTSPLRLFSAGSSSVSLDPSIVDPSKSGILGVKPADVASGLVGSSSSLSGSVSGAFSVSGLYVSPSSFRFAMQLQKIKEMSARTDGRFKSFLSMFYGARSRDSRLDRPEFIGGSVQEININEVEQNSETTSESPLGTLAGRAFSAKRSYPFEFVAHEHTIIIGLVHIMPDSEYIGGLERTKHYTDPFDYALPQFAGLSEQPIRMSEIAFRPTKFSELSNSDNEAVYGYEPRYNELRVKHNYATGAFRDYWNATGSKEYYKPWLITRQFGYKPSLSVSSVSGSYALNGLDYNVPSLSDKFLSMRDTVDYSNFEVTNPEIMMPFMLDSYFNVRWTRIIPSRGIPRI